MADLGEASEFGDTRHGGDADLCGRHFRYGLRLPSFDDIHLYNVISLYYE